MIKLTTNSSLGFIPALIHVEIRMSLCLSVCLFQENCLQVDRLLGAKSPKIYMGVFRDSLSLKKNFQDLKIYMWWKILKYDLKWYKNGPDMA